MPESFLQTCLRSGPGGGGDGKECATETVMRMAHSLLSLVRKQQGYETRTPGGPAFHLGEMSEKIKLANGEKQKWEQTDWGHGQPSRTCSQFLGGLGGTIFPWIL